MKKSFVKLLTGIFALGLVVMFLRFTGEPVAAYAEVTGAGTEIDPYQVETWDELAEKLAVEDEKWIKLTADCTADGDNEKKVDALRVNDIKHVDTNGHKIDKDSAPGGWEVIDEEPYYRDGAVITAIEGKNVTLDIYSSAKDGNGQPIKGTICGGPYGGIIVEQENTTMALIMENMIVEENDENGGISLHNSNYIDADVIIKNCIIQNNIGSTNAGGITLMGFHHESEYLIEDVTITGNEGAVASGLYISDTYQYGSVPESYEEAVVKLAGNTTITNNTLTYSWGGGALNYSGGGFYDYGFHLELSGNVVVKDNYQKDGTGSAPGKNLVKGDDAKPISVAAEFTGEIHIGFEYENSVNNSEAMIITSPWENDGQQAYVTEPTPNFVSDVIDLGYKVGYDAENKYLKFVSNTSEPEPVQEPQNTHTDYIIILPKPEETEDETEDETTDEQSADGQVETASGDISEERSIEVLETAEKSNFSKLQPVAKDNTEDSVTLNWKQETEADGYMIYGNLCNHDGHKYKLEYIKTVDKSELALTLDELTEGTYYKYQIVAFKIVDGKRVAIAKTPIVHTITKGGKYGVAKAIRIAKIGKKSYNTEENVALTLKKGKTIKVSAKEIKEDKTIQHHRNVLYVSDNKKVATVNKKGQIVAKGKGTCTIYIYAQNGVYNTITVTVP